MIGQLLSVVGRTGVGPVPEFLHKTSFEKIDFDFVVIKSE